jgi:hypothetical protein
MTNKFFTKINTAIALPVIAGVLLFSAGFPQNVSAAALISLSDEMSSQKISTASSHKIKFTTPTGTSAAGATIVVTFPADFNFTGKAIGSVTFTHGATTGAEASEPLLAAPSATAWGAVFSGTQSRVLTLTAPTDGIGTAALAPNDKVILTYTSANAINGSTATSYNVTVTSSFGDSGSILVNLLTDDQVLVSATVPQSLTFSISDNTIGFGALTSASARFATGDTNGGAAEAEAHNIIVGTNAANGYSVNLSGTTLTYGGNTITAIGASNVASAPGTEQFGLRMTASGGTGVVSAPYAAAGFAFDSAAFPDQVASASGASADTTYSVRYLANIGSATEAGSYSAALTYTATANY